MDALHQPTTKPTKKKTYTREIMLALVFFAMGYFSFNLLHVNPAIGNENKDLALFWKVWNIMEEKYPFDEPNNQAKIYGAIEGLVASYDDEYSSFLPPVRSEFFTQTIAGEFGGAGMEIGVREGYLSVISPLKNSPAEKAGILPNDIITHIDGIDITGFSLDEAIGKIRGKVGTTVVLTIARKGEAEPLEITITREVVHIPIIETEEIDQTFIIHLYNFNESSDDAFEDALKKFKSSGKDQLLIDVRNNPGGYLGSAINIASYFLKQGDIVVREQHGEKESDQTIYRSRGYDLLKDQIFKTFVLINEGSASASEILAGALEENGIATIVGEASYGKGSVQELIPLPNDTSLKVTVAQWLTPQGNQISKVGIEPQILIPASEEDKEEDTQLKEALYVFNNH
mgnify:CR=1 FL=1